MASTGLDYSVAPSMYFSSLTQTGVHMDELLATRVSQGTEGAEGPGQGRRGPGASISSNEMLRMHGGGGSTGPLVSSMSSNKMLSAQGGHGLSGSVAHSVTPSVNSATFGRTSHSTTTTGTKRGHGHHGHHTHRSARHLSGEEEEMERRMTRADMGTYNP